MTFTCPSNSIESGRFLSRMPCLSWTPYYGGFIAGTGDTLTIASSEALLQVSMVRMGSSTHSPNTDQRRLELCDDTSASFNCDTTATVTVPGSGVAIPGYWMVFGVNAAGVPSVAATITIQ